jgi:hypothetical protein
MGRALLQAELCHRLETARLVIGGNVPTAQPSIGQSGQGKHAMSRKKRFLLEWIKHSTKFTTQT